MLKNVSRNKVIFIITEFPSHIREKIYAFLCPWKELFLANPSRRWILSQRNGYQFPQEFVFNRYTGTCTSTYRSSIPVILSIVRGVISPSDGTIDIMKRIIRNHILRKIEVSHHQFEEDDNESKRREEGIRRILISQNLELSRVDKDIDTHVDISNRPEKKKPLRQTRKVNPLILKSSKRRLNMSRKEEDIASTLHLFLL
jgi:hypothetical protein